MIPNISILQEQLAKTEKLRQKLICQLYYQRLKEHALTIIGDPEEAEETASEVFCELLHQPQPFIFQNEEKAGELGRNALNQYLHNQRQKRKSIRQATLEWLAQGFKSEVLPNIYLLIKALPRQRRRIMHHIYIDGQTTEQIALQMGISPQTVRNQKTRALKCIKQMIRRTG